ncbi:MAG: hypothetical protein JSW06_11575 [Thermoplasmatales archaeon]|nr:MAG: hypothetical protein JSW06_11575 [Thermoplasmatales archaeon]
MEKTQIKVKIDKDVLDKAKEYDIDIEAFMDTGFRRYVDYIVYKNKLEKQKKDFDTGLLSKGLSNRELKNLKDIWTQKKILKIQPIILDIIRRLCDKTADGNASLNDIINEAEILGIETVKIEEAVDRLTLDGKIYEAFHRKYRVSE